MVKNRKYLPEYAYELLRLADADLPSGRALVAAVIKLEELERLLGEGQSEF